MSMKEKLQVFYIESPQAMGLQLYYESRDLSLLILLPEDIDGLDEVKGSVYSSLPPFLSPLVIFVFFLWVYVYFANACKIILVMFDSVQHHWPTKFLCPWDSIDKNTGVGSHFLLQGNFLTQGLNLCLFPQDCCLQSSTFLRSFPFDTWTGIWFKGSWAYTVFCFFLPSLLLTLSLKMNYEDPEVFKCMFILLA